MMSLTPELQFVDGCNHNKENKMIKKNKIIKKKSTIQYNLIWDSDITIKNDFRSYILKTNI